MRAAYFDEHGGVDVLRVGELPAPELTRGSVRIAVKACALNHLDLWVRIGGRAYDLPLPHVGGTDLAGVVIEVGEGGGEGEGERGAGGGGGPRGEAGRVRGERGRRAGPPAIVRAAPRVGDEVLVNPGLNFAADEHGEQIIPARPEIIGETRWGGLATECVVPAANCLPKPRALSWPEAAAVPLTGLTAMQMLRKAGLTAEKTPWSRRGEAPKVLVPGGAGGVSVMAIQLAKALGAWVVATTSTGKVERVAALGADHVIDYRSDPDWGKTAYGLSDKTGFDVVVDSVGEATWPHSIRALRPGGRLVTCGATTGPNGVTDIRQVFWKQLTIRGSTMGTPADLERALAFVAAGTVKAIVDSVMPLEEIRAAHARLERGEQLGKVVLTP